ncbi:hypothetical protein [Desulfosarcina sp.]|uniref:hypothetical protein n=1 Tax=Desulfosarcina sp. TaxID=2027861 RepID=UPI0029BB88AA|nr:hypothetical protein [Desulfosarcina sp.]MDX2452009.1 hypothetical protein [Desulfosarcina sp.]MDX2489793.1 hypothetical protein [Desulfosarcina sp.]
MPSACTRFSPPDIQRDMAAEQMVAGLRLTNADLTRFKCVGKIILSGPNQPAQTFRAALAGQLTDRLRIDMFAPFGGSAGTVSSDGKHLFLVMHPSREYYKRRFGSGSLEPVIKINVTVGDLLELLVGRIPMDTELLPRLGVDENEVQPHLVLVDRWGRTHQRVTVDDSMHPVASEWFDGHQKPVYSLTVSGTQIIDGFVLPKRIDLSGASGERVTVILDRYEANARFDDSLFVPAPPPS